MIPTLQTRRIPIVAPAYAGRSIPTDWQRWAITKFRDIREIKGCTPQDRIIGIPVYGDSLKKEGIFHNDILITKVCSEYKVDKLAVWQTPDGQTAKYARENFDGSVTLHNRYEWTQRWQPEDLELIGMVVRVERDIE